MCLRTIEVIAWVTLISLLFGCIVQFGIFRKKLKESDKEIEEGYHGPN